MIRTNVQDAVHEAKDGFLKIKTGFQKRTFTKPSRSALVRTFVATPDDVTCAGREQDFNVRDRSAHRLNTELRSENEFRPHRLANVVEFSETLEFKQ